MKLSTLIATLGKRLNGAVSAYNETVGSYEARILPAARRFADHGAVSEGARLPEIEPITLASRSVNVGPEDVRAAELQSQREVPSLFEEPRRLRAAE